VSPRYPESQELVRAVATALGETSPTQAFARLVDLDVLKVTEQRKFLKWWGGHNRPSLPSAVLMLRAAGMLDTEGPRSTIMEQIEQLATRLEADPAGVPSADLEAAENALRQLSEGTRQAAEALAARRHAQGGQA
jgi:hypothetical protein